MRIALVLSLVACSRVPEPQGPRVVCNGMAYPVGSVVLASSNCQELPADHCWNDNSPECEEEAERRREANESARKSELVAYGLLLTLGVVLVVGLAVSNQH